jgi:hypothetical protein
MSTYALADAARAARTNTRTLRRRIDIGTFKLRGGDIKANGSGTYCGLTRPRVLQVAITQHLTAIGMSPSAAADAASQFSDCGDAERGPGDVFPYGKTLLIIDHNGARVINADFDVPLFDATHRAASAVVIDCNQIAAQVDAALTSK